MEPDTFTLLLSRGTHVISGESAATLLHALDNGLRSAEIQLDLSGGLDAERTTVVATCHIVAMTRNPPRLSGSDTQADAKITRIVPKTHERPRALR
jgi:hypothetical protein